MRNRKTLLVSILLVTYSQLLAANEIEPDGFAVEEVAENFYILKADGFGTNIGLSIGIDGILLVDPMAGESNHQRLVAVIRKISEKPIKYVLNTHADADHSGANKYFHSLGATIISHENSRFSPAFNQLIYSDKLLLNFNQELVEVTHIVSHSFSDSLIYFPASNVLFMGDAFTTNGHPTFYAGGIEGQRKAIDVVLSKIDGNSIVVPGHGFVVTGSSMVTAYGEKVGAWVARVEALHYQGLTTEKMMEDIELKTIKGSFNLMDKDVYLSDARFHRHIERTISTEFISPAKDLSLNYEMYTGRYQIADGSNIEISPENKQLYVAEPGKYKAKLIPLNNTRFYIRGFLGDEVIFPNADNEDFRDLIVTMRDTERFAKKVD